MTEFAYSLVIRETEPGRATITVYAGGEFFMLPTHGGTLPTGRAETLAAILALVTVDMVAESPFRSVKAVARAWEIAVEQHLALSAQVEAMALDALDQDCWVNVAALAPIWQAKDPV